MTDPAPNVKSDALKRRSTRIVQAVPLTVTGVDALGRPFGWRRVYAVDASVLPSIPGTTLAFAVMANAARIAEQAPIE